jgi:hypothetical protein
MKKLQLLLYVGSIVVAVGIGMTQVTTKSSVVGNVPCNLKFDFDGGACLKKAVIEGSCEEHYPTVDDTLEHNNAKFDVTQPKVDYCDAQTTPCQSYLLYPSVDCDVE